MKTLEITIGRRWLLAMLLPFMVMTSAVKAQSYPAFDDVSVSLTSGGVRLCWTAVNGALYYKIHERSGDNPFYCVDSTSMNCFDNASYHPTMENCYYVTAVLEDGHELISNEACIGFEALDFAAIDIHGNEFHLFEILDEGQFVFIDFFSYTCFNCREAIPYIVESYYRYGCNDGDVFYVEINARNSDELCSQWGEEFGVEFPTISADGGGRKFSNLYHIDATPHFILIAPDHTVVLDGGIGGFYITDLQSIINAFEPLGIRVKDCNTDVYEKPTENGFLFPNPSDGFVNLLVDGPGEIRVYSVMGQLMDAFSVDNQQVTIETSLYPRGMYFVQVNGKPYGRFMVSPQ